MPMRAACLRRAAWAAPRIRSTATAMPALIRAATTAEPAATGPTTWAARTSTAAPSRTAVRPTASRATWAASGRNPIIRAPMATAVRRRWRRRRVWLPWPWPWDSPWWPGDFDAVAAREVFRLIFFFYLVSKLNLCKLSKRVNCSLKEKIKN